MLMRLRISAKKRNRVSSDGCAARARNEEPIANGGVSELGDEICLNDVPRECLSGVQFQNPPGFPLEACGNDERRIGDLFNAASCDQ